MSARGAGGAAEAAVDLVTQHGAQFGFDGLLEGEGIERVEEFLQRGDLAAADFPASLESLGRCGRLVVDAFFAAADDLGAQLLHHRAEEVAQPAQLVAVKVIEQSGGRLAFEPHVADQLAHMGPVLLLDAGIVVLAGGKDASG